MKKGNIFMAKLLAIILPFMPFSCPSPNPPQNNPPETNETETNFGDNGEVEYTVSGTDKDGSVDYISVKINGEHYGNFQNHYSFSVPIIEGNNTITTTAVDNEGEEDPTPATGSFYSPTKLQASDIIANALNPNTYDSLKKNAHLSPGNEEFIVNALINAGGKDRVIDYLTDEQIPGILEVCGIPYLCVMKRTSEGELERKAQEFQNSGYTGYNIRSAYIKEKQRIPNRMAFNKSHRDYNRRRS